MVQLRIGGSRFEQQMGRVRMALRVLTLRRVVANEGEHLLVNADQVGRRGQDGLECSLVPFIRDLAERARARLWARQAIGEKQSFS